MIVEMKGLSSLQTHHCDVCRHWIDPDYIVDGECPKCLQLQDIKERLEPERQMNANRIQFESTDPQPIYNYCGHSQGTGFTYRQGGRFTRNGIEFY